MNRISNCSQSAHLLAHRVTEGTNTPTPEASLQAGLDAWVRDPSSTGDKATAAMRIMEAFRTRANNLRLSHLALSTLPPEIGQLTRLRYLYLNNNQLKALPPEIGQLTRLIDLYLNSNRLTDLPSEIGQLTQLIHLYLNNNQLKALPPEIGQLTQLERLYLSDNQLTYLPQEIGQLTRLRYLYLNNNQLKALPPEIGRLHSLLELFLNGPSLSVLPIYLGQATRLTSLKIWGTTIDPTMHDAIVAAIKGPRQARKTTSLQNKLCTDWQLQNREANLQLRQVLQFSQPDQEILNEWLTLLEQTTTKTWREMTERPTLICKICNDLLKATTDTAFKADLLAEAKRYRETTCPLRYQLQIWQAATKEKIDLSPVLQFSQQDRETLNKWLARLALEEGRQGTTQSIFARGVCEKLLKATTDSEFKANLLAQAESSNKRYAKKREGVVPNLPKAEEFQQKQKASKLEEQYEKFYI